MASRSAASFVTASCGEEAALKSGPEGQTAPGCVCRAQGQPRLPFFFLLLWLRRAATLYFNLPGTVWDGVRAPQAVFGDGKSPFEVLLVRARAELMSGDSSKRAAAGQYFLQGY